MIVPFVYEFLGTMIVTLAYLMSGVGNNGQGFGLQSQIRGIAYVCGWIIASTISGAHFNPATSLAVYLMEGQYKDHAFYLIGVIFI